MAYFDNNNIEHISNGHYNIGDQEFMSIWTFKDAYAIPRNEHELNKEEGDELIANGVENHICKIEVGKLDKAHIYPVDELIIFYAYYSK